MNHEKKMQLLDRVVPLAVFAGIALIGVWMYNPGGDSAPDNSDLETLQEFTHAWTPFRMRLAEYYLSTGKLPASNQDLDFGPPESFRTGRIRSIGLTPEGTVRVEFDEFMSTPGAILFYRPVVGQGGGVVSWDCASPNTPGIEKFNFNCRFRPTHEMFRDAPQ